MKKIYLSFFSAIAVFSAQAQLTQVNNAPANGDTYVMYQCDTISPGASGANAVWNFASINTHSSIVISYTANTVSNSTYPSAPIAVASAVNNTSYYNSSATSLLYYGGNVATGSVVASLTYTAPAVKASYPMSLSTTSSAATSGTISVTAPLPTSGTFNGNSSVLADGSGTINLPGGGTYTNVIRVLTTETITINTSLATATVIEANYNYYASGVKAPIFSIATSTATINGFGAPTTQTIVTRNKNATGTSTSVATGISENTAESFNFVVYPNPSNTYVNFVTNSPDARYVSVYDITGKLVEKQTLTDGKIKVDVSSYNKGLYLYTISAGDSRTLKSGKVTVSQ
jgi:hypothetical protein